MRGTGGEGARATPGDREKRKGEGGARPLDASGGSTPVVIAIDGGAGTGKTTSAALVAERLGFCYVDSGAVYRAVALALREGGIADPADPRLGDRLASLTLRLQPDPGRFRVFLGERELGEELRTPAISRMASQIAVRADVRELVTRLLREAGRRGPMVVEGRDIGTVVFPDADLKVYLRADLPVRAARRRSDLLRQGIEQSQEEVEREMAERDQRDSHRKEAPLRMAPDALVVDTSRTDIEGQVRTILEGYAGRRSRSRD